MYRYHSAAQRVFNVFNVIVLTAISLLCILPFVNLWAISFSSNVPVSAGKVLFWPVDFSLESYKYIFVNNKFIRAFGISIIRVLMGVTINLVMCILTAYPLSRSKDRMTGRNWYMGFFVLTMIIGGGLIPTYIVVMKLHLLNSMWALVLPGALPVWNMIILMNFIRQIPQELEDAAMIDGAGPMNTLLKVLLPLLKPALATIGLFCVVGHWNDWFSGLIYMRNPANYPLQTYLQTILRNFEAILRESGHAQDYLRLISLINARTSRAAQVFVSALPVMAIYPFLQKYFVTGLVIGSVKG
jgi:putative aldouronate transport system permease protein